MACLQSPIAVLSLALGIIQASALAPYLIYGIGGDFLIYLTNSALYLTTETAEFRPAQVYNLDNELKVFALSARAALAEETMYRLFAIPFLVSVGMRFYDWRPRFRFKWLSWGAPRRVFVHHK